MKTVMTVCVYGDFEKKDVRLKVMREGGTHCFEFQNILRAAGYDAELFTINDEDIPHLDFVFKDE